MRKSLVDACRGQGLAVVGYTCWDASIMDALNEAIDNGRGFPGGNCSGSSGLRTLPIKPLQG